MELRVRRYDENHGQIENEMEGTSRCTSSYMHSNVFKDGIGVRSKHVHLAVSTGEMN